MLRRLQDSGTRHNRSSDLERLWRALVTTNWRCLVVIPADPATSVDSVLTALRMVLPPEGSSPLLEVVDGRGASIGKGSDVATKLVESCSAGRRVVAFIDPITQSLAGVPVVRVADSILLVVQIDSPDVDSLSSTLSIVGADRVIGAVAVPSSS